MGVEIMSFRKVIPANTPDLLSERVKGPGTIEGIKVKFYPGQQKALRIVPFVEHKGSKTEQLITYPSTTDQFLAGDDDYFIFPVIVEVDNDDFVKIRAVNTDLVNAYTCVVDVIIDYYAGKKRVIGGLLNG